MLLGEGWPDGNVPSTLSGFGRHDVRNLRLQRDQKWVKAKYSRYVTNIMNQSGTNDKSWKTYTKADWDALGVLAADPNGDAAVPSTAVQLQILGSPGS